MLFGRRAQRRGESAPVATIEERATALAPDHEEAQVVLNAYYERAVAAPDAARSRAQASFSITSAVAAVVLAALSQAAELDSPAVVLALLLFSALAWLTAAWAFTRAAVSVLHVPPSTSVKLTGPNERAGRLLAELELDRNWRDGWLRVAHRATAAAIALSSMTGVLLLQGTRNPPWMPVTVRLTDSAQQAVGQTCGTPPEALGWTIRKDTLEAPTLVLRAPDCMRRHLIVGREEVALLATAPS